PGRSQHQQDRELGDGFVQHARGIRAEQPGRGRLLFVDSIVADAKAGNDAAPRQRVVQPADVFHRSDNDVTRPVAGDRGGQGVLVTRSGNTPHRGRFEHIRSTLKLSFRDQNDHSSSRSTGYWYYWVPRCSARFDWP